MNQGQDARKAIAELLRGQSVALAKVAELLEHEANDTATDFTSTRLPPDLQGDRRGRIKFAERCKRIAGAKKFGTVWQVSREAYEAAMASPSKPRAVTAQRETKPRQSDDVDSLLAGSGLARRAAGGAR